MDSPHLELVRGIHKRIAIEIPRAMPQHLQRLIHANDGSLTHTAREPLHFHFDIANGYLLR